MWRRRDGVRAMRLVSEQVVLLSADGSSVSAPFSEGQLENYGPWEDAGRAELPTLRDLWSARQAPFKAFTLRDEDAAHKKAWDTRGRKDDAAAIHETTSSVAGGGGTAIPATAAGATADATAGQTRPHPNLIAQSVANSYVQTLGLPPVTHGYVPVDQTRAGRIADAYDALPVDDSANPAVRAAYEALGREVQAQWDFATSKGMKFEPWTKPGQPYQTSLEMAGDVSANQHLYFYTGGTPHPFLGAKDASGLSLNDKFRAIHDYFGHAAGGYGFGPRGEENAWIAHSQMFSNTARPAMTTETRGQNSYVNFGRQNYNPDGSPKNIPADKRPFAKQKVALLPPEFWQ